MPTALIIGASRGIGHELARQIATARNPEDCNTLGQLGAEAHQLDVTNRASKAALNSVLLDAALTYGPQGATCVSFHPGWVQTDMGGSGAPLSAEQSAGDLRATLAGLDESAIPEPRRHANPLVSHF
jgi:NAD(P)-dependent dehydrogenase (short-subunit alcohol dehydrogenase family)